MPITGGHDRPRVLLLAEQANPRATSVPLIGWSLGCALMDLVDGHLVTQVRNREAILAEGMVEGTQFTTIDSEAIARPVYRAIGLLRGGPGKGWTTVTALGAVSYYYFEQLVWKQFGPRLKRGEFDVVHRLTPPSPTTPSLMARRCKRLGVPFVLGPINGGLPWPREHMDLLVKEREFLSFVRSFHKVLPGHRATRRDSAAIITGSKVARDQMPAYCQDRIVYVPENAIDPARFPNAPERTPSRPLRLIFLGRLVPYKGCHLALEAASRWLRDGSMTFDIVGDGPQRGELEELVRRERIGPAVTFHGNVEHEKVAEMLGKSDIFLFPSIREFGGAVALEASAMGAVPVIVNYGGPSELVTPETAFLVEMGTGRQIIEQLTEVLDRVNRDPAVLEMKRAPGIKRSRTLFTWPAKARQITEVYRWVLGRRPEKPEFSYAGEPSNPT